MSRIPYLEPEEMTPRQREVNAKFLADRAGEGRVSGPVAFWMRNPELGLAHEKLRIQMERNTSYSRDLSEIPIVTANRHWSAEFPWCRHQAAALRSGCDAAPIDAIRTGAPVVFADPKSQVMYDFSNELLRTTGVSDATYSRAIETLGLGPTIELTGLVAYGSTLSISSNTFGPDEPEPWDCELPVLGPPDTRPSRAAHDSRVGEIDVRADMDLGVGATARAAGIWSQVSDLSAPWLGYEEVLRRQSSVRDDIRALITLAVAQFWRCPQLWAQHRPLATAAGISDDILAGIAGSERPSFDDPEMAASLAFVDGLFAEGIAADAVQDSAIDCLGTTNVIELVAIAGYQSFVAMCLNVFDQSPAAEDVRL